MAGTHWWERPDLGYVEGRLQFGGRDLAAIADEAGTPAFVYRAGRALENLERLRGALGEAGVPHDAFYAIKANRFAPLVRALRASGRCGIDACSPAEVEYALAQGFPESRISFTGTSVSDADLDRLARRPGVHINCDAISTIRRLAARSPGRSIGLRVNPELGAGYNERLRYAGAKATKFGIYPDRFDEAVATALAAGMPVTRLHFHIGSGYLGDSLGDFERVLGRVGEWLDRYPAIRTLNVGGGLGVRLADADQPIDLARWSAAVARHALPRGLCIQVEPGDYLVRDAGALLVRVNTVEDKGGTRFVGVDAGLGIQNLAAYYRTPFIIAPLRLKDAAPALVTVAGNINEAIDLLAEDVLLPAPEEGDLLALLNAGGYGSSAASNHCMRGEFRELLLDG